MLEYLLSVHVIAVTTPPDDAAAEVILGPADCPAHTTWPYASGETAAAGQWRQQDTRLLRVSTSPLCLCLVLNIACFI